MKSHLKEALLYGPLLGGLTAKPPWGDQRLNAASRTVETRDVYWKLSVQSVIRDGILA